MALMGIEPTYPSEKYGYILGEKRHAILATENLHFIEVQIGRERHRAV